MSEHSPIRHEGAATLLNNSSVFITGASGFVGKVLLEKLLRDVPGIDKFYVLIRPKKGVSPSQRLHEEIVSSKIFTVLLRNIGEEKFREIVARKLIAVPGDISHHQCGIPAEFLKEIYRNVRVIFHCAASINFQERIDRAIELNVKGAVRMMEIALNCESLVSFVHVSTAYVNCNQPSGSVIQEKLYPLGFDPERVLEDIERMNAQQLAKVSDTGLLRDYPNTYTFTKAIAEHVLVKIFKTKANGKFSLSLVRPAIVCASWKEPMPGWIDDISAASAIYAGGALGVLKFIPAKDYRYDLIPVDLVVNGIILAAPASVTLPEKVLIIHCGSSSILPVSFRTILPPTLQYARENPPKNAFSKPSMDVVSTPQLFQLRFFLQYSLPASILNTIALFGTKKNKRQAAQFERLVFKIRALLNTFGFFFNQEWVFVADTTRRISDGNMDRNEKNLINFTFDGFQWENFSVIYLYGITKFVFGEDLVEVSRENVENPLIGLNDQYHVSKDIDRIFKPRTPLSLLFPDIDVVLSRFQMHPRKPFSNVALVDMKSLIMNSKVVQEAIKEKAKEQNLSIPIVSKEAEGIISKMVGDVDPKVLMGMAVALRKAFKVLFTNVYVNEKGIEALRRNLSKGPVIYLPTHRSYLDFLIISYVCFLYGLPVPFIAAGEDFLGMFLVRSLFRFSGAFFLRRSFSGDKLYSTIFGEYVKQLLVNGHSLEFFIEGTRSRSGKMLHPKMGLLNDVTQVYLDGGIPNAVVCPITINFEKTVEGELYKNELLGDRKVKESLSNLLKSLPNLFANLGRISIHFSENPFDLEGYVKSYTQGQKSLLISDAASRMTFNEHLAYKVVYELCNNVEVMPTHIVASLLLMYRQGITKNQLIQKSDWLRGEILKRNGKIAFIEGSSWPSIVTKALYHLRNLVIERRQNVYEPINDQRVEYRNMLLLGHYRNKLVHLFFEEAIWACAFYSFGEKVIENGVTKEELIVEAKFLYELLEREVINRPEPNPVFDVDKGLEMMINRGVFNIRSDGKIHVPHSGETLFSFLISIGWPFIDSYYVTAMALFSLQPAREIDYSRLLSRAQWLATTLYHESRLCFYESCSIDTLQNSIYTFAKWGILKVSREAKKTKKDEKTVLVYSTLVKLLPPYQDDQVLQNLVSHIHKLCKPPPIRKNATRRAMIADIPILAKL